MARVRGGGATTIGRATPACVIVTVALAGMTLLAAVGVTVGSRGLGTAQLAGLAALTAAAALAELFPVPLNGVSAGGISLAAVFITGSGILFGWQAGAIAGVLCRGSIEIAKRRPLSRFAYNGSTYALAGASAGVVGSLIGRGTTVGWTVLCVGLASGTFYVVNVVLVALIVASVERARFLTVLVRSMECTVLAFGIMASVTLMLEELWNRSPLLLLALVGPLLAVALYQRSTHQALEAMRLALTDPVTGLGNHRHFHESLDRAVSEARPAGSSVALCMLDVDDLKSLNDRYGHPLGDRVLAQIAHQLRRAGEAFRLGGDEFALLLAGVGEQEARAIAAKVLRRLSAGVHEHGGSVSASCGVAVFPAHGRDPSRLIEVADTALYWAKAAGKNQVKAYADDLVALAGPGSSAAVDRADPLRAAASLARAVDERDVYTGAHSQAVGELAARIARAMDLDRESIEEIGLAGRLHDLGKLAVPEDILRKPQLLTDSERAVIQRHPQIAFRMLGSLGLDEVARLVLHHHERWDGGGYPDGLAGEAIPLGARIIFVADAFDAMTTKRVYRETTLSRLDAIAELEACAGTQFDPAIVKVLVEEIAGLSPVAEPWGVGLRAAAR